jgi:KR domain
VYIAITPQVVIQRADPTIVEEAGTALWQSASGSTRMAGAIHAAGTQVQDRNCQWCSMFVCKDVEGTGGVVADMPACYPDPCVVGTIFHFVSSVQIEARIAKATPGVMRQVIAPKAAAVENFGCRLAATPMVFSLLCSSVSAVAGYSGQVNLTTGCQQAMVHL